MLMIQTNAKTICQITSMMSQMKTSTSDAQWHMLSALQYTYCLVIIILQSKANVNYTAANAINYVD